MKTYIIFAWLGSFDGMYIIVTAESESRALSIARRMVDEARGEKTGKEFTGLLELETVLEKDGDSRVIEIWSRGGR